MTPLIKIPENWTRKDRIFYQTAQSVAVVAAIFVCTVCILIITNFIRIKRIDPLNSKALKELYIKVQEQPRNELLKEQIREFDLLARRAFFSSSEFAHKGAYLLLGGIVVLLIALKIILLYRRPLPCPGQDDAPSQETSLTLVHYGVGALGGALILVSFMLTTLLKGGFNPAYMEVPAILKNFPKPPSRELLLRQWPNFRGPGGNGIAFYENAPIRWDGRRGEGILWKSAVPKAGFSSPVVWGSRLFLSGGNKKEREVYCYNTEDGTMLWRKAIKHIPGASREIPKVTDDTGYAAPTMAVDGRLVFAIFATGEVACFDFDGALIWGRSLGIPDNPYGHASSLMIHKNLLLIQYDHAERARLLALDVKTGKSIWERVRDVSTSWASPIVVDTGSRKEVILSATPFVISYDPVTGDELWRLKCMAGEVGPSPAYADGMMFAVNRYARLSAIGLDDKVRILWEARGDLPDVSSPLATGDYLFIASSEGEVTCFNQKDGQVLWKHEFDTGFYASPILTGERVYLLDKNGTMRIFKKDAHYISIANPHLGEGSNCTPAFLHGRIYIRGKDNLYCIGGSDNQ
jgi:outer membrane protein assembly factor BamB